MIDSSRGSQKAKIHRTHHRYLPPGRGNEDHSMLCFCVCSSRVHLARQCVVIVRPSAARKFGIDIRVLGLPAPRLGLARARARNSPCFSEDRPELKLDGLAYRVQSSYPRAIASGDHQLLCIRVPVCFRSREQKRPSFIRRSRFPRS